MVKPRTPPPSLVSVVGPPKTNAIRSVLVLIHLAEADLPQVGLVGPLSLWLYQLWALGPEEAVSDMLLLM